MLFVPDTMHFDAMRFRSPGPSDLVLKDVRTGANSLLCGEVGKAMALSSVEAILRWERRIEDRGCAATLWLKNVGKIKKPTVKPMLKAISTSWVCWIPVVNGILNAPI